MEILILFFIFIFSHTRAMLARSIVSKFKPAKRQRGFKTCGKNYVKEAA